MSVRIDGKHSTTVKGPKAGLLRSGSSPLPAWLANAREDIACSSEMADSLSAELFVDMAEVETIVSHELSELIRLQLLVRETGRELVLINVSENLVSVFTITRLDRLIQLRV